MGARSFNSNNRTIETLTFQTNSDSGSTFNPTINKSVGRVSWDMGDNGGYYIASNNPNYTYNDNGTLKTVKVRSNNIGDVTLISSSGNNIVGHLDASKSGELTGFLVRLNPELTGITNTYSSKSLSTYDVRSNDLLGTLDLSMFQQFTSQFFVQSNNNLKRIIHTACTKSMTFYYAFQCDITGEHDVSMFTNIGPRFSMYQNSSLTAVTHSYSNSNFNQYYIDQCDITGTHDVSMFPNLGGEVSLNSNSNLNKVIHTASTQTFTRYHINSCDIIGNHDLSMFPNLGGTLLFSSNSNLTGITHTYSPQVITYYASSNCDITGNHDVSMFPNLGGTFTVADNPNLTSVTHTASTQTFSNYYINDCNITGTHDVSMLTSLGGSFRCYNNSNLTDILFPHTTETFLNTLNSLGFYAFAMYNCGLGYVNFLPLSSSTMDVNSPQDCTIDLSSNGMTTTEVNHILVDFDNLSTNLNPSGWSGVTLDIGGTNATPDTTSGGYNGIAAIDSLTGITNNWSITTS